MPCRARCQTGLSLSADGTLSGIPRKAGTFTYTVVETNLFGAATKKFTQTILPWFDVNADGYAISRSLRPGRTWAASSTPGR